MALTDRLNEVICQQVVMALGTPVNRELRRIDFPKISIDDIRMHRHFQPVEDMLLALRQLKGRKVEDVQWIQARDAACHGGGETGHFRILLEELK